MLVVDDDPLDRTWVTRALPGACVVEAATIAAAESALAVGGVACAIVDLGLPDGDAVELVRAIAPRVPVVVLSGAVLPKRARVLREIGAHSVLEKGVSGAELARCVADCAARGPTDHGSPVSDAGS